MIVEVPCVEVLCVLVLLNPLRDFALGADCTIDGLFHPRNELPARGVKSPVLKGKRRSSVKDSFNTYVNRGGLFEPPLLVPSR
jgi:hypothetical protein